MARPADFCPDPGPTGQLKFGTLRDACPSGIPCVPIQELYKIHFDELEDFKNNKFSNIKHI